jgi:hypothetical protein
MVRFIPPPKHIIKHMGTMSESNKDMYEGELPPTMDEALSRLKGSEGIFTGLTKQQRKNLITRGKDYPLGL